METTVLKRPAGFRELAGYFFLLKGIDNLLLVLLTSLFLKRYGPAGLPWFYVSSNILFISSQLIMLRLPKWKGHAFLSFLSRPLILFSVGLAMLGTNGPTWPQTIALLVMAVYDLHATQAFSDMSGQILPLREAKLHLPTVYAAGTAGSILSGLSLKFFLDGFGIPSTFLAIALLLFIANRLLARLRPFMGRENEKQTVSIDFQDAKKSMSAATASGSKKQASESPFAGPPATRAFATLLIPMSCAAIFGRILTEFLYTGNLSTFFSSTRDLASFLGIFGAAIDICVLGMQSFLGGAVFARFRLGTILGFRGGAMVLACATGFLLPSIWTIAGTWFILMSLTKAFINPAFVILIEPLPKGPRFLLRRYLSLGDSTANLLAGLTLLALKSFGVGADPVLFLGVGAVYGAIWALTRFADRLYTDVVSETLTTAEGQGDLDIIRSVRFIPRADRIARIAALLGNPEPEVRHRAILEAAELEPHDAAEILLVSMAGEENPRNLASIARVILRRLGSDGVDILEDMLRDDDNPRLQADMIEALGQVGGPRISEFIAEFLSHENHRIRGNAVLGILRQSHDRSLITRALDVLKSLLESREAFERSTAAVVMGGTGLPVFVSALGSLADDGRENVVRQAFTALADIRTPAALRAIGDRRTIPGRTGELAEIAWKTASAGSGNRLARLLAGLSASARGKIGFWLRSMRTDREFELLTRILYLPDEKSQESLISALGNGDSQTRELIASCLIDESESGDDEKHDSVRINVEPLLTALRKAGLDELPVWVELVGPLCGPRHDGFTNLVCEALTTLWKQAVVILQAEKSGLFSIGQSTPSFDESPAALSTEKVEPSMVGQQSLSIAAQANVKFEKRLRTVMHLTALVTPEPARLLEALGKSTSGDTFLHSVALEFLEERLGDRIAQLLFPLLERKSAPAVLLAGARERCGFDPAVQNRETIESELKGLL
ncbi:MAG: HEAT repeat domain-containing protein [Candidatus Riflebacteria bacterium]|nr:HEAT repeat domain-containing protein [Candidatus Riflebacteria bacterium]